MSKPIPPNLRPQAKLPPVKSFHDHPYRWLVRHWFYRTFRVGKVRCPSCGVVGSYNPFGAFWKDRDVRRWLCKWCGYYNGTDGQMWCVADRERGCWMMPVEQERESAEDYAKRVESGELTTPQKIMQKERLGPF